MKNFAMLFSFQCSALERFCDRLCLSVVAGVLTGHRLQETDRQSLWADRSRAEPGNERADSARCNSEAPIRTIRNLEIAQFEIPSWGCALG